MYTAIPACLIKLQSSLSKTPRRVCLAPGGVAAAWWKCQAKGLGCHVTRSPGGGNDPKVGADGDGTRTTGTTTDETGWGGGFLEFFFFWGGVDEVGDFFGVAFFFGGRRSYRCLRGSEIDFSEKTSASLQEELQKVLLERHKERLAERCVEQLAQLKEQLAEEQGVRCFGGGREDV